MMRTLKLACDFLLFWSPQSMDGSDGETRTAEPNQWCGGPCPGLCKELAFGCFVVHGVVLSLQAHGDGLTPTGYKWKDNMCFNAI